MGGELSDADGDPVTITITGITQDEPTNGLGDGDTSPDGKGIGTSTASVRAERSGKANGRVYIIYFTVLLVQRERRDHAACRAKYGADWDRYTAKVRWRILPGVY